MAGFLSWGKTSRLAGFFDLLFKGAGLIAALIAANFFQQPHVMVQPQTDPENPKAPAQPFSTQAFIDVPTLEEGYRTAGKGVPLVVRETARMYNTTNRKDLYNKTNTQQFSVKDLCANQREEVEVLFPTASCEAEDPTLGGRKRSYAGLLLKLNDIAEDPLDTRGLRRALVRLREAEYSVVRYEVWNDSAAFAENVQVLTPDEFLPSPVQPFSLAPHQSYAVSFQSPIGTIETTPPEEQLDVPVSWDKGAGVVQGGWFWLIVGLGVTLVLMLIWAVTAEIIAA